MLKNRGKRLFSIFYLLRSRKGFTLIELLVFAVIFSGIMIAFISILVTILGIQSRQSSVTEVTTQSNYLLQKVEYLVEHASLIELPQDTSTTTLKLRMPATTEDPTFITLSNGIVYLQQGTGPQNPLTSNKVSVSALSFNKHSNPPGHDSVSVSFLVSYNSPSLKQQFSQTLNAAIARASAATFDANLIPSSTATFDLGVPTNLWRSVNNVIYFSGSNVGIGTANPSYPLHLTASVNTNYVAWFENTNTTAPQGVVIRIAGTSGSSQALRVQSNGGSNELLNVSASGKVGIGTAGPQTTLDVNGPIRTVNGYSPTPLSGTGVEIYYDVVSGAYGTIVSIDRGTPAWKPLDLYGSVVTLHNQSDEREKTNIYDLSSDKGLTALTKLRPVIFNWKDAQLNSQKGPQIGLLAQDVQGVFPDLISVAPATSTITLADGSKEIISNPLTLNYEGFIVPLIKAVQELNDIVVKVKDGIAHIGHIVSDFIETHTLKAEYIIAPHGITTKDTVTGEPYCMRVANGQVQALPGECE